jgi:hypothetical protein
MEEARRRREEMIEIALTKMQELNMRERMNESNHIGGGFGRKGEKR